MKHAMKAIGLGLAGALGGIVVAGLFGLLEGSGSDAFASGLIGFVLVIVLNRVKSEPFRVTCWLALLGMLAGYALFDSLEIMAMAVGGRGFYRHLGSRGVVFGLSVMLIVRLLKSRNPSE